MAKPWKIPYFDTDEKLTVCLQKILRTRYHETFSYEDGTIEGSDIEVLHSMRVSNRRLKAMMKIFRECFPKNKFESHYEHVRSLLRSLGQVRDCDVFISLLEEEKRSLSPHDQRAIDLLIARQKQFRHQQQRLLIQKLRSLRHQDYEQVFFQFLIKSL